MKWYKCLFYGSLRKGEYNNDRMIRFFGEDQVRYIKTVKIPGYKLYDTGFSYPAIIETNTDDCVVMDIMEIGEEAYDWVHGMEISAGYILRQFTKDKESYFLYVYTKKQPGFTLVESGNWLKQTELH